MDREELKTKLTPEEYHVTQEKGTERPFENAYWNNDKAGKYMCKVCGQLLFASDTKLDTSTGHPGLAGWPAFSEAIVGSIEYLKDSSFGMERTEVICSKCKSHLGHIFDDKDSASGKHFCVNSCSLNFDSKE